MVTESMYIGNLQFKIPYFLPLAIALVTFFTML